jgi:hypothetical protein
MDNIIFIEIYHIYLMVIFSPKFERKRKEKKRKEKKRKIDYI